MSKLQLQGRVILVTGGAGFLASQFIPELEAEGAVVEVLDINGDRPVDIVNAEEVRARVAEILATHSKIDGFVHAAAINPTPGSGTPQFSPYEDFPIELWKAEFDVNLTSAQIVMQAISPHLKKSMRGSVVFISSDLGLIAPNNSIYEPGKFKDIAYVSSKAGLLGLMRGWASYLGPYGVRVNALVPGGMENGHAKDFLEKNGKLNMLGRMARPGEYNAAITFLLSESSTYMTGSSLVIDGGRTAW
ncbi:SDR family oxidoreductase [Patescibacteria group bacterium]|nr:SDR family oxidoreductase [Patescibacteria group bacterium]MBU1755025.1 SDR family oxidoreductase [Patescibacteria group bacterium]